MILYLTKDLMLASNVRSVAAKLTLELVIVPNVEKLVQRLTTDDPTSCRKVIVDLQTPGLSPDDFATIVESSSSRDVPVVGYAQHVYVDLINAAQSAGFSQVFTRGQMNGNVAAILQA